MAWDNIQLICEKYEWDNNVDIEECNFFSPFHPTFMYKTDLLKYLNKESKIKVDESLNSTDKKIGRAHV